MPDFSEFADDAKKFAGDHPQQTDEALKKADDFADQETGNRYGDQIDKGEQTADRYLDGGQNQGDQGNQGGQGGQGGQNQ